jgi:hypothetical protein
MFDLVLIFLDDEDDDTGGNEAEGDAEDGGSEEGLDCGPCLRLLACEGQRVTANVQFERVSRSLPDYSLGLAKSTWFIMLLNTAPASGDIVLNRWMYFTM